MAITTYAELQSSLAAWLNRSDLTAVIPDFISLAEVHFNRVVRAREMQGQATANITTPFFAIPADFLEVKAFRVTDPTGEAWELIQATPEQLSEAVADSIQATIPRFFTIIGDQFQIWPVPDQQYVGNLIYFRKLPSLSATVASNWMLEEAPDIYLYGSLMQAAQYLRDPEGLATWKALLDQSLEDLRKADKPVIGPLRTDLPVRGLQRRYNVYTDY